MFLRHRDLFLAKARRRDGLRMSASRPLIPLPLCANNGVAARLQAAAVDDDWTRDQRAFSAWIRKIEQQETGCGRSLRVCFFSAARTVAKQL